MLSLHGRLDDRADTIFPTDPYAKSSPFPDEPGPVDVPVDSGLNTTAQPSHRPGIPNSNPESAAPHDSPTSPLGPHDVAFLRSPFRNRADPASGTRPRRLSAARLWNPTNSTPRFNQPRKRRPSTPPPPSVPLHHPDLDRLKRPLDSVEISTGDYPLLTLPEQRQTRHSASARASLQIEHSGSEDHRVSLPRSIRASYDGKRSQNPSPLPLELEPGPEVFQREPVRDRTVKLDKGKGRAVMAPETEEPAQDYSRDLERGPEVMDPRLSNVSAGDGIGSAISSSNSSIMGEDVQADTGEEWGPQHPCYPHMNPHVPIDSPEYAHTRIIRIRRDWLLAGDLAPTFSNLYPEILDPAGLSEPEFRRIIEKLNGELVPAFNPYSFRNILDSVLGLVTGWLWDDFGLTSIKSRLNRLEAWIEKWNIEMAKTIGGDDRTTAPKIVSLRRTGYMTVSIATSWSFIGWDTNAACSSTFKFRIQKLLLLLALMAVNRGTRRLCL